MTAPDLEKLLDAWKDVAQADFQPDEIWTQTGVVHKDTPFLDALAYLHGFTRIGSETDAELRERIKRSLVRRGPLAPVASVEGFRILAEDVVPEVESIAALEPCQGAGFTALVFVRVPWKWRFVPFACRRWTKKVQALVDWHRPAGFAYPVKVHPAPIPWPWRRR